MQLLFLNHFILSISSLGLLQMPSFLLFKSLNFSQLRKSLLLISLMLLLNSLKLFLFNDLHSPLFERLGYQDLQYRINFLIKIEQILTPHLCLLIYSSFLGDKQSWKRSIDIEIGLAFFLTLRWFIRQKFLIFICLDKNMLSIWHRRGCIGSLTKLLLNADPGFFDLLSDLFDWHIASPLLLLGYFLLLGNNCCIGISSNNSWIVHGISELVTNN